MQRWRGMADSRKPAANGLKAAAAVWFRHPDPPVLLSRSLLGVQIGGLVSTVILSRKYRCETVVVNS